MTRTARQRARRGCHFTWALTFALSATNAQAGDPVRGEAIFQRCRSCHDFNRESKALGPSLAGLFGRKAGSLETFRYSPAMRRSDIVWDDANLDRFLAEPQTIVRGNRMPFSGLPDRSAREDLISYLHKATVP